MNMSDKPQWLIIGRGKNGWHASAATEPYYKSWLKAR
jgi:hypothetical protein